MKFTKALLFALVLSFGTTAFAQNFQGPDEDIKAIQGQMKAFSKASMDGDNESIMSLYTEDVSIFPPGADITQGKESIRNRRESREEIDVLFHKLTPMEIVVKDDTAWDYGIFEGTSIKDNKESSWKGKYVVIWKKIDGEWLIYLDIWNSIQS